MSSKKGLKLDAFVASVRPDPSASEQVQLLQGYLGKSNVDGHVRVYFDEALNNFIEVPENDILHALPCDKSENALGGCRLWVKKSAVVTFGDPKAANRLKSSFLEGDLMSAYGNFGITPQGLTPFPTEPFTPTNPRTPITTITQPQISWRDGCPSLRIPCYSQNNQGCLPVTFEPQCRFTLNDPGCFFPKTLREPDCIRVRTRLDPECFPQTTPIRTFPTNPTPVINLGQIGGQLGPQIRGTFNPYNY